MTSIRRFNCRDLLAFNNVNLDYFTETYHTGFYTQYLAQWPEYCLMAEAPGGQRMGYILGKVEGEGEGWHGHVTAVTVAPAHRRLRLAQRLMAELEAVTERVHDGFFVDLFVRASNAVAAAMYGALGYTVYRRVLGYYADGEDALDMRKAMRRDVGRRSVVPLDRPVYPHELEHD